MALTVLIRRRFVRQNRPIALLVTALFMAVIAGINLGIGLNYDCFSSSWDSYCDYRRKGYIISGSCFAASAVCFFIGAVSLHLKIKKALRTNQDIVVTQQGTQAVLHPSDVYPNVIVAEYPMPQGTHNNPPIGFAPNPQSPPIGFTPGEYHIGSTPGEYQQLPPPYASPPYPSPPVTSTPGEYQQQPPPPPYAP